MKAKPNANRNVTQPKAESESESEIETDVTLDTESGRLLNRESAGLDAVITAARSIGVNDIEALRVILATTTEQPVSTRGALELVRAIASKAKRDIRNVDAYIATTCRRSAAEVQQAYFDLDIGGIP